MPEKQATVVVAIAGVYRSDGMVFTEEALHGWAAMDSRFEYEEETGKLFFTTTWGEACLRGLSWNFLNKAA